MNGTVRAIGRLATRAAMAGILVALVLGVATAPADAATKIKSKVGISANEFADVCDEFGASDITVRKNKKGDKIVTCTWSDGFSSSCNFSTKECVDTIPRRGDKRLLDSGIASDAGMIQANAGGSDATATPVVNQAEAQEAVVVAASAIPEDPTVPEEQ
ncbi:MAG TPA: hypothetical protein VIL01_16665 [Thermomicrobiales bacterium]